MSNHQHVVFYCIMNKITNLMLQLLDHPLIMHSYTVHIRRILLFCTDCYISHNASYRKSHPHTHLYNMSRYTCISSCMHRSCSCQWTSLCTCCCNRWSFCLLQCRIFLCLCGNGQLHLGSSQQGSDLVFWKAIVVSFP